MFKKSQNEIEDNLSLKKCLIKNHFIFNIVLVVGDLQFHFEIF